MQYIKLSGETENLTPSTKKQLTKKTKKQVNVSREPTTDGIVTLYFYSTIFPATYQQTQLVQGYIEINQICYLYCK